MNTYEVPMVGILYGSSRANAKLLLRMYASIGYNNKEQDLNKKFYPDFKLDYEQRMNIKDFATGKIENKGLSWLEKFYKALFEVYAPKMMEIGSYPKNKEGYSIDNLLVGYFEIGIFSKTMSYSDETYYVIRSDYEQMNDLVGECLQRTIPAGGACTNPMGSYKARGGIEKHPGYSIYHQFSYGIGD